MKLGGAFTKALSLGTLLLASTPAMAQFIPIYNVEKYCRELAAFGGGSASEAMVRACFSSEQSAYDRLKAGFQIVPVEAMLYCKELNLFGGGEGSYSMLVACLNSEMEAKALNRSQPFKY